jgi:hypothetical protein
MNLRRNGVKLWRGFLCLRIESNGVSFAHGNKYLAVSRGRIFFDWLSCYQILTQYFAP